jgi:hypothetical protein
MDVFHSGVKNKNSDENKNSDGVHETHNNAVLFSKHRCLENNTAVFVF